MIRYFARPLRRLHACINMLSYFETTQASKAVQKLHNEYSCLGSVLLNEIQWGILYAGQERPDRNDTNGDM